MFLLPTINLKIERWKFNKDYGIYVSTLGNFKDRHKRRLPIKINSAGYCMVKTEAPKGSWKLAHRVVMLTWKSIPDAENLTVDHLNHNKRCNELSNLEWVTEKENLRRAKEDCIVVSKKPNYAKFCKENFMGWNIKGILFTDKTEAIKALAVIYPTAKKGEIKNIIEQLANGQNTQSKKMIKSTLGDFLIEAEFKTSWESIKNGTSKNI